MVDRPREAFLGLLVPDPIQAQNALVILLASPPVSRVVSLDASPASSSAETEAAQRIEALEDRPPNGFEWDESSDQLRDDVVDDVNGLGLSTNRKTSFLGLASIFAAIKVLAKVLPSPVASDDGCHDERQILTGNLIAF